MADHQKNFCLNENYAECPVFQNKRQAVFPAELRFQKKRSKKLRPWIWLLPILVGIGALLFFPIIPGLNISGLFYSTQVNSTEMQSVPTVSSHTPVPVVETTISQVVQPTLTPLHLKRLVSESNTPINPPHTLDSPIGITYPFIIHRIQEGESLGNLAVQYNTDLQSIQEVNFFLPDPVWVNWLVIIPVDTTNVIGLPKFEANMVVNGNITIESFAANQDLDPFTLKFYNGFPDGYVLSSGEWLLIPHNNE